MNILFLSSNKGQLCSLSLKKPLHLIALILVVSGMVGSSAYWGYQLNSGTNDQLLVDKWQQDLHQQQVRLKHIQQESDASVDALSSRLGLLQAHVMRLDALGRKLINMASIDQGEFDFDSTPALGGPETVFQKASQKLELSKAIEQLSLELNNRESQLQVLENLVMNNNLQKEVQPSGRPIKKGWLSSYYGMRTTRNRRMPLNK